MASAVSYEGGLTANRYQLTTAERSELTGQLLARYQTLISSARAYGEPAVVVTLDGRDPLSDLGRDLEHRVFNHEAGGAFTPDDTAKEYVPYDDRSVFTLCVDLEEDSVVGATRGVLGSAGFGPMTKSMRDVLKIPAYQDLFIDLRDNIPDPEIGVLGVPPDAKRYGLDRRYLEAFHQMQPCDAIYDVETLVVEPGHRIGSNPMHAAQLLIAGIIRSMNVVGITHIVTFIRTDLLHFLQEGLRMNFVPMGGLGPAQYIEGDPFICQPAYLSLRDLMSTLHGEVLRREPDLPSQLRRMVRSFPDLVVSEDRDHIFAT